MPTDTTPPQKDREIQTIATSEIETTRNQRRKTPLELAASASELAAVVAPAAARRRVLGVAAAELRALPPGRVSCYLSGLCLETIGLEIGSLERERLSKE